MAKRAKTVFVCSQCGNQTHAWAGKCAQCGAWNTLEEQVDVASSTVASVGTQLKAVTYAEGDKISAQSQRMLVRVGEIDSVLGGGIVPGSVLLLAGQPGIGKSTMLLQLAAQVAAQYSTLYVSGEESPHQVLLRASRLGIKTDALHIAASTSANDCAATIAAGAYRCVIVDSIQTMAVAELASAAGTVSQISNSTQLIMAAAKQTNCAVILVGHVTKEGSIAGPKVLEHVVDVVLQLEGDRYGGFKILRSMKNRFGSTNEIALFSMEQQGLTPVLNPSEALLSERRVSDGSVVLATMEGSRAMLVEVQALVHTTSFGYPKRTASGFDINRLNVLVAVLEKRTKLQLSDKDIYINIVGGMKVNEPAADLAVCMAIASAAKGMKLKTDAVVFGEVGLSGEIRHVPYTDRREAEALKLGFTAIVGPKVTQHSKAYMIATDVRAALNSSLTPKAKE